MNKQLTTIVLSRYFVRAAMGSTEQRLGEAVRLMREQGSRSDVDTGAIFEELERRLLAEIGAG